MGFLFIAVIYILLNAYLALRLGLALSFVFSQRFRRRVKWIAYGIVTVLSLVMMLGLITKISIFSVISAVWMGIFVNLLLVILLFDLVRLILKCFFKNEHIRKIGSVVYRVGILILPLLFSLYGFINAATVTVTTYDLTVDKPLQPLKIVMISDLHLGAVGAESNLDDWVEAINQEEPDVVLIAGDLIDSDFDKIKDPLSAEKLLASIKARYGVYACLGNHDSGGTYGKMLAFFERAEITVLRDSYQVIDDRFVLIGRYDISPIGSTYLDGKRQDTKAFLDSLHVYDLPTFVMDHNPKDVMAYDSRVDLVLSGHTHKGQVFPGNLVTDLLYPVDYGLHQQNEDSPYVVVSSGIFGWGMPMKTSGHSEIVVINIESSLTEQ